MVIFCILFIYLINISHYNFHQIFNLLFNIFQVFNPYSLHTFSICFIYFSPKYTNHIQIFGLYIFSISFEYLMLEYLSIIVTHVTIFFKYYVIIYSNDIQKIYSPKCQTFLSIFVKYVTSKYFTFLLQYLLYILGQNMHQK